MLEEIALPKTRVYKERPDWGSKVSKETLATSLRIAKTVEHREVKWSPRKPDFYDLEGEFVMVEFSPIYLANSVSGTVGESEDNELYLRGVTDLRTLEYLESRGYIPEAIWRLHVLESPEVTDARDARDSIEKESLDKALEPSIAMNAHTIIKLRDKVERTRVAELVNFLAGQIAATEESTDEAMIIGEKMAGGPSRKEKELSEFVQSSEKVQHWVKDMQKQEETIVETSIEQIMEEARKKRQAKGDNDEVARFADWIEELVSVRDSQIDDVIRGLYFDLSNL